MDSTGTFLYVLDDTEGEAPHPVLAIGQDFPFAVRGCGEATDSQSGQLCCSELVIECRTWAGCSDAWTDSFAVPNSNGQTACIPSRCQ